MTINDDKSWLSKSPLSTLTRRGFIGVGSASAAGLLLTSCTAGDDPGAPSGNNGDGGGGTDLTEAPQLTEMVEAGDLPPLDERLPKNPLVITTVERAGVYGGTWHTVSTPNDTGWMLQRVTGMALIVRWNEDFTELIPDAAEEFSMNEDATEARFKLREGIKWSDGEPYTAEDIVFAINDVWAHPDLFVRTTEMVAEAVSDYEVVIRLEPANGLYLQEQAGPGRTLTALPKHYLKQFHKDYNENVDELVEQEGYQDWIELFLQKGWEERGRLNNPELPVLSPWIVTEPPGASGTRVVFSRNPYFWKTDQDGRQLPYIDQVEFNIVEDPEVMVTAASNGEVDMSNRTFNIPRNKPVLAEHRESGDYHFIDMPSTFMNTTVIGMNQTVQDEAKREIFGNKDFRIAISHAINRQEIIDVVFQRQGEPWQAAPRADTKFYDEEFAKQYTEHNVDLAKEHLAKAGVEPGSLSFSLMVSNFKPEWVDVAPLLQEQIGQIGVEVQIDSVDNTLFNERINANEHEVAIWQGDGGGNDLFRDPRWYFPFAVQNSQFATAWAQWFVSNGELGEEPSDAAKEQMDLYNQIRAVGDPARQDELMAEILKIAKEQFWAIGIHLPGDGYGIVKNNFHNVPNPMIDSYYWSGPGPVNPEQFFIQD